MGGPIPLHFYRYLPFRCVLRRLIYICHYNDCQQFCSARKDVYFTQWLLKRITLSLSSKPMKSVDFIAFLTIFYRAETVFT